MREARKQSPGKKEARSGDKWWYTGRPMRGDEVEGSGRYSMLVKRSPSDPKSRIREDLVARVAF